MARSSSPVRRCMLLGACALSLAAASTGDAAAQTDWPNKPIRIVVPLTAGGAADTNMRAIAAKLQAKFGQPVVVENKPGASGTIAFNAARQAPADGYTLMLIHPGMLSAQMLLKTFDVSSSFQPISMTGEAQEVLFASNKSRLDSLDELLDRARAEPGKLNYASIGIGSIEHLVTEDLCDVAKVQLTHVPYKGGSDVVQALASGDVDVAFVLPQVALPYVKKGILRPLATLSQQRQPLMPNVPTFQESKLPVRGLTLWSGVVVSKGTPAPVVKRLYDELVVAMKDPEVRKLMQVGGTEPTFSASPAEFGQRIDADLAWIRQTVASRRIVLN